MSVSRCLPLHGHTIRFTVWASGKQNSVLEDVVLESRLPFVQIRFIYRKTASKTLIGIKGGFEEKKHDQKNRKTLSDIPVDPLLLQSFHLNVPKSCQVFYLPVLSNCNFVNSTHVNDKLQWVNCSSTQTTRLTSIAVPCRCGLRGGYIELVGFIDQLRSRVKTYLSPRSCPSTIGQVRIMYVIRSI